MDKNAARGTFLYAQARVNVNAFDANIKFA